MSGVNFFISSSMVKVGILNCKCFAVYESKGWLQMRNDHSGLYLQPVLQLDDGAVQDRGRELSWDGDNLGHSLPAGG